MIKKLDFSIHIKKHFFSDSNEAQISVNKNIPKDLVDGFFVQANMKKLKEKELEELRSLKWREYQKP